MCLIEFGHVVSYLGIRGNLVSKMTDCAIFLEILIIFVLWKIGSI